MKTRTGFVSNSSSSSFIVKFDKDPSDINNLKEMLGDCAVNPYGYFISTDLVVETVFKEIQNQKDSDKPMYPFEYDEWDVYNDMENMLHTLGVYDIEYGSELHKSVIDEMVILELEHRTRMYYMLKNTTPEAEAAKNEFTRKFTFSDENGSFWAAMEHGGVFRNVEHEQISHH